MFMGLLQVETNVLNGPPVLGRLLNLTEKMTPFSSGPATAVISPLTLPPSG